MFKSGLLAKSLLVLGMPMMASAAFKYWNPADTSTIPKTLSELGIYTNIAALPIAQKKLDTNIIHFDVGSPLWSDGAHKNRWVMLKNRNKPNGAGSIKYDEKNDYWGYPDSAVFIKNFAIDTNGLDTNSRVLWETRVLLNKKDTIDEKGTTSDRWYGYSYKWNADQKDAKLISLTRGQDDSIRVWPNGTGAGKTSMIKKWHFPSTYECERCHQVNSSESDSTHGRAVLGFFTAQLNHKYPDNPSVNQLEYFFTKKVLTGVKSNWDAATTPRWHAVDDSTASVDARARAYIAANCSGCHGRRGIEKGAAMGVDFNYDFHNMAPQMEYRNHPTSWAFTLDDTANKPIYYPKNDPANVDHADSLTIDPALVVPGYPHRSVILFRQTQRNTEAGSYDVIRNQMPPLATFEVNTPAVNLLTRWIKEMPALPIHNTAIRASYRQALKGPIIRGGLVILSGDLASPFKTAVKLTGIDGRTMELRPISKTTFALPANLPKGVYVIRVGEKSFTRYLF
jgi:hypothetical protein